MVARCEYKFEKKFEFSVEAEDIYFSGWDLHVASLSGAKVIYRDGRVVAENKVPTVKVHANALYATYLTPQSLVITSALNSFSKPFYYNTKLSDVASGATIVATGEKTLLIDPIDMSVVKTLDIQAKLASAYKHYASIASDDRLYFLDLDEQKVLTKLSVNKPKAIDMRRTSVAVALPDRVLVITYNPETKTIETKFIYDRATAVALTPDASAILYTTEDGTLKLYDLNYDCLLAQQELEAPAKALTFEFGRVAVALPEKVLVLRLTK